MALTIGDGRQVAVAVCTANSHGRDYYLPSALGRRIDSGGALAEFTTSNTHTIGVQASQILHVTMSLFYGCAGMFLFYGAAEGSCPRTLCRISPYLPSPA